MTPVDAVLPDLSMLDLDTLRALVIEKHTALISHQRNRKSAVADSETETDAVWRQL
jgi:hypothetical protein